MIVTLTNSTFEELTKTEVPDRQLSGLSHHAGKKAAVGAGEYLH